MAHDMSIHTYEIGDTLSGTQFAEYLGKWGCNPMRPTSHSRLERFICMKEPGGYQEVWDVTGHKPDGEITEMTRIR